MFRRMGLFLVVNILVVSTIGLVMNLLGVSPYLSANGINYQSLLIFCLMFGMGGSFISLSISKWMAKRAYRMQEIAPHDAEIGYIATSVHQFAKMAGIEKMPEVYIYDSPEINAFATGPSKNNSLVAVSAGLARNMSRDEVEGVLAHEVAHIANGDMVTMALAQGVLNAFVMFLSRVGAMLIDQALRGDDEEGEGGQGLGFFAHMMLVYALDMFFGFLCMPILMWFSRFREFRADDGGAKLAGREKMIAALEKLKGSVEQVDNKEPHLQAFKISDKSSFLALFSSHPPLDKRISALRSNT
ncbi:MAG: zinc metalloprotease HtpX [Bacteriovorax sp. MedPE-SWde]|nr:MAG: zinc metalloprotease HtpX [Bacteriovorax sp. MedPE-SWde]